MNNKAHIVGGFISGSLYTFGIHKAGWLNSDNISPLPFIQTDLLSSFPLLDAIKIFTAVLLSAMFPDLDTASKSRFVCYRFLLIAGLLAIFFNETAFLALIFLFAILPQLSYHRGLTHSIWAPLMLTVFYLALINYDFLKDVEEINFSLGAFFKRLLSEGHLLIIGGIFVGYFTHMFLDSRLFSNR